MFMPTRISHISDNHSRTFEVPEADLYVFSGDCLPDKLERTYGYGWRHDKKAQYNWIQARKGTWRKAFGIKDQPVICLQGNHDWYHFRDLFGGEVYDEQAGKVQTIAGLKVGLVRGVTSCGGFWNDEKMDNGDFGIDDLDYDIDLLVTHSPPHGILDLVPRGEHIGSQDIRSWYTARDYALPLPKTKCFVHCFGHVHDQGGKIQILSQPDEALQICSNAATTINHFEIDF